MSKRYSKSRSIYIGRYHAYCRVRFPSSRIIWRVSFITPKPGMVCSSNPMDDDFFETIDKKYCDYALSRWPDPLFRKPKLIRWTTKGCPMVTRR